jgi:hypothetical protein
MQQASSIRLKMPNLLYLRAIGGEIHKNGRFNRIHPNLNELIERNTPPQSLRFIQNEVKLSLSSESAVSVSVIMVYSTDFTRLMYVRRRKRGIAYLILNMLSDCS